MKKLKHLHLIKRWKSWSIEAKVWSLSLVVIAIIGGLFGWAQYQDWRNEQFLRDIVADFDRLETDLEEQLGMDVEDKSGCFTTSEKFSEGKTACFARIEISENSIDSREAVFISIERIADFDELKEIRDTFYKNTYRSWPCEVTFNRDVGYSKSSIECPVPVRGANKDLVAEIF